MFSDLLQQLLLALLPNEPVYYIGGSEVLPPPLSREEETAALTALCAGEKSAERTLIEHNLRLVVYIARRFENTGVGLEDLISIEVYINDVRWYKEFNDVWNEFFADVKCPPTRSTFQLGLLAPNMHIEMRAYAVKNTKYVEE